MDPLKLAIFLFFFVAFLIVARRIFSSGSRVYASDYLPPDLDGKKQPAVIGSELPFPTALSPVQQLPNGRYNRPKVLNYYFSNLDLKSGPENPRAFCDQLFVQFEAPETGAQWTNEYTVATPFGLQSLLDQTGQNLSFEGTVIIVAQWDMTKIMRTVLDDMMERYANPEPEEIKKDDGLTRFLG